MKNTLKFLAATALVALFAAPMHASSAHLQGPGYWGPHYGSGLYRPWHGRGFGRGHGPLSGGIGFSMRAGGHGRGWGRGYSRPYWAHHRHHARPWVGVPHHARHWHGAPQAMMAPATTSSNGTY
jgi:hypothetical protein